MPKKPVKSNKKIKKATKYNPRYILCHPSTWIAAALLLALLVIYGVSIYGFKTIGKKTELESAELATFGHIAKMYIKDMDFTVGDNQEVIKKATGYGVSNEDDVLYITFDFAPYPAHDESISSSDDLELRHGIIYFQWDSERNTYGHAFGYYDDASYHPDGTYVRFED